VKPESGGGLFLLRHVTPLARRHVVYFCSGAYNEPFKQLLARLDTAIAKATIDDVYVDEVNTPQG
jgi:hypothetical protein